ncbi:MAG: ImmA/IrrE family metallo-endopeptidase [Solirubrobacterales bacterium]|nr:ImmA/IrrE family metallo-endopeptidase [Solirubrobacterales bacterium]
MKRVLDASEDIRDAAERLLVSAGAKGQLPTPIDELMSAAGLHFAKESLFGADAINSAPPHLRTAMIEHVQNQAVLAMLDRDDSSVHLNPTITNQSKKLFSIAHEIGHAEMEWHDLSAYADSADTFSRRAKAVMEQEANQFAADLLFQNEVFVEVAEARPLTIETIKGLHNEFGPSIHSTFRRYVETHSATLAGVVVQREPIIGGDAPTYKRHEAVCSPSWRLTNGDPAGWPKLLTQTQFGFVDALKTGMWGFAEGASAHIPRSGRPPLDARFEIFDNSHKLLVLLEAND